MDASLSISQRHEANMNNSRTKTATLTILLGLILFIPNFAQVTAPKGSVWKPVEVNGDKITQTNAFVNFSQGQARFTGNTGCNTMKGTVVVRGKNKIDLQTTILTRRACKLMEGSVPEDTFVRALNNAVRYQRHGQTLALFNRRGIRVIRFVSTSKDQSDDDASSGTGLADKKWFLESIGNRKTFVAMKRVFVNFMDEKGTAGGDTGCSVFGGSYTAGKRDIAITDIMSTMRACEENGKMQLEREFLDGLRNANRYEIIENRLRLYRRNELLLTLRGEPKG
jgi:heat shock protein HslJ